MTGSNSKFISVVIPAHNEEEFISQCLESLVDQSISLMEYEIIVVDNNSFDNTKKIVQSFQEVIYHFKKNGPVGAVRNYGVAKSNGPILVFMDADCVCTHNWLEKAREKLINSREAAFGGRCSISENANWLEKYWLLQPRINISRQRDLIGSCICVSRHDFLLAGEFREDITSGEDTEFGRQLRQFGIDIIIDSDLNVVHLGNARTVKTFICRQIWHSENYMYQFNRSVKDPTFILILIWIVAVIVMLLSYPLPSYYLSTKISFIVALSIPAVFTVKRIVRAKEIRKKYIPVVYFIDTLYVLGRSVGVFKGVISYLRYGYKRI